MGKLIMGERVRQKCIQLYERKYYDFGHTLASEKLEECDGIKIKRETLRRILIKEGLWIKKEIKQHIVVYEREKNVLDRCYNLMEVIINGLKIGA